MNPFALPYDPASVPIIDLVGLGFRPAWQPADFIGPRMDCPMWLPAPDADVAYSTKYDTKPGIDPYAPVSSGMIIAPYAASHVTAADLAQSNVQKLHIAAPRHPATPTQPWTPGMPSQPSYPCHCIERPPLPPLAPVPIEAGAAPFLVAALSLLFARSMWRAMGRFGDWFCAERGTGPGQNGWV